jgi:hypothetical protein
MNATLAAELKQLSSAEKLPLVEERWNDIAKESNTIEPPAWHDRVLAEDATEYAANPVRGDSWSIVKERIIRQAWHGQHALNRAPRRVGAERGVSLA